MAMVSSHNINNNKTQFISRELLNFKLNHLKLPYNNSFNQHKIVHIKVSNRRKPRIRFKVKKETVRIELNFNCMIYKFKSNLHKYNSNSSNNLPCSPPSSIYK